MGDAGQKPKPPSPPRPWEAHVMQTQWPSLDVCLSPDVDKLENYKQAFDAAPEAAKAAAKAEAEKEERQFVSAAAEFAASVHPKTIRHMFYKHLCHRSESPL